MGKLARYAFCIAVGLLVGYGFSLGSERNQSVELDAVFVDDLNRAQQKNIALSRELRESRNKASHLASAPCIHTEYSSSIHDSQSYYTDSESTEAIDVVERERRSLEAKDAEFTSEAFIQKLSEALGASSYSDLIERQKQSFSNEPLEFDWASAEESRILSMFSEDKELFDVSLVDAECRSKSCRLVISTDSLDRANVALEQIGMLLSNGTQTIYQVSDHDPINRITEVYLSEHPSSFNLGLDL